MTIMHPDTGCPDTGRLRSWLDGEAQPAEDAFASHLAACDACERELDTLSRNAMVASKALSMPPESTVTAGEIELALANVHLRLAEDPLAIRDRADGYADPLPVPLPSRANRMTAQTADQARPDRDLPPTRIPMPMLAVWHRWRLALGGLAAAVALTLTIATPQGQALAATFLAQFRSQRLAIVTFDPNQTRQTGLFRMERLGTVQNNRPPTPVELGSAQEAASKAGFPVLQPDPATLPAGAAKTPKVRFSPASETRLTFDKQKTREYFDSINRKDLSLPEKLDGSTLVVALPPIVMLEYPGTDNKPAVMIGQAREVQVGVEGRASLDEVRAFMLSLPDLPPELARQLRSISDWTTTLPIPVPIDKVTWQETTIAGAQAYILNDNTGLGSGVIWQRDSRILGVAGPMKATDLRKVAESLR